MTTDAGAVARRAALLRVLMRERGLPGPEAAVVPVPRDGLPIASFAQHRIWFLDQVLGPRAFIFGVPLTARLWGPIDVAALEYALNAVVARQESLRTTFGLVGTRVVQRIHAHVHAPLSYVDISAEPDPWALVTRHGREHGRALFDITRPPLLRATLLRLAEDDHVLLFDAHHIVWDGTSTALLVHELATHYQARLIGRPPDLPQLGVHYADWADWQRRHLSGATLERHLDYWRAQVAEAPAVRLPSAPRSASALSSDEGATETFTIDAPLTAALGRLARAEGATLFQVLLAAWTALVHRLTGEDDFTLGILIANRQRAEIEPLIGYFVNTVLIRSRIGATTTFAEHLARVRATTLGAYEHQALPIERVIKLAAAHNDRPFDEPLYAMDFQLQNAPRQRTDFGGHRLEILDRNTGTADLDVGIILWQRLADYSEDAGLQGWCEYRTELFDPPAIRRLLERYVATLTAVAESPSGALADLTVATPAETQASIVRGPVRRDGAPAGAVIDGVELDPIALAAYIDGPADAIDLGPDDIVTGDTAWARLCGATPDREPTVRALTPIGLVRLLDTLGDRPPAALRAIVCHGVVPTALAARCRAQLPGVRLVEVIAPGPIALVDGRPPADTAVYLLDRRGRPVPPCARGELAIGAAAAAGVTFPGDAARTAAHLTPDPFSLVPGGRLYRTGLAAARRADGAIELRGPRDRGELAAIEAALTRADGVREAAVRLDAHLVAAVVPSTRPGTEADAARVRHWRDRGVPVTHRTRRGVLELGLSAELPAGPFGLVALDSVVQHFPSGAYLERVLHAAIERTAEGGRVHLGDLRNLALLRAVHTARQLDEARPDTSIGELRERIERAVRLEPELAVDPRFFWRLRRAQPRIATIELVSRGTRFHAVLHLDTPVHTAPARTLDWSPDTIDAALAQRPPTLLVRGVPLNPVLIAARLFEEPLYGATAQHLRRAITTPDAVDLAPRDGYAVTISLDPSRPGLADALFHPAGEPAVFEPDAPATAEPDTNHPARIEHAAQLIATLRSDPSLPTELVVLDELPRLPSGAVNYAALPTRPDPPA